jgi:general secretion pathway protein K
MRRQQQQGIAVITVLLALAIAVLICSEVITQVYSGIKRSEHYFNTQQAWEYALSGEAMARQVLAADFENDKMSMRVDHLHEKWAAPLQILKVPNGKVAFQIYDMQSRFNLNNLIDENGGIQPSQVSILRNLMAYIGIRSNYADMAARWASYDKDTGDMYGSDKAPYLAGDTQFGSVSELRLLRDLHMDEYRRISPYLSALPVPVRININTAPEAVLLALTDGSEQSVNQIKAFVAQRGEMETGYSSTAALTNLLGISGTSDTDDDGSEDISPENGATDSATDGTEDGENNDAMGDTEDSDDLLGVSSEYFEVRVIAQYGTSTMWLVSTVFRDNQTGEIRLLSRDASQKFSFDTTDSKKSTDNSSKKTSFSLGSDENETGNEENNEQ